MLAPGEVRVTVGRSSAQESLTSADASRQEFKSVEEGVG